MSVPDAVAPEWRRRVDAEYRSAAITQEFVLWLIQLGTSIDLIRDGLRIVDDELEHARLSHEVFLAAGGGEVPTVDRAQLGLRRQREHLEEDVVLECVRVFCLGETVAVPPFRNLRAGADQPLARATLDRILRTALGRSKRPHPERDTADRFSVPEGALRNRGSE